VDWVTTYIEIPWRDGGRTREGCDCYGLVRLVLRDQLGIEVDAYDQFYTSTETDRRDIAQTITRETAVAPWVAVPTEMARLGDVAIFRIGGLPMHCGIMLDRNQMLNIRKGACSVVESIDSILWRARLAGMFRYVH